MQLLNAVKLQRRSSRKSEICRESHEIPIQSTDLPNRCRQCRGGLLQGPATQQRPALSHRPRCGENRPTARLEMDEGFRNNDLALPLPEVLKNIQAVQLRQNLPVSAALKQTKVSAVNLDIEMETGTGKTYCYIKTMFELNKRYGWSKFIVVVPSIAIREGVAQVARRSRPSTSWSSTARSVRSFIYNSKHLHNLESFSLRRRHQRDGHQRPGLQCARQGCPPHLRRTGRFPVTPSH